MRVAFVQVTPSVHLDAARVHAVEPGESSLALATNVEQVMEMQNPPLIHAGEETLQPVVELVVDQAAVGPGLGEDVAQLRRIAKHGLRFDGSTDNHL